MGRKGLRKHIGPRKKKKSVILIERPTCHFQDNILADESDEILIDVLTVDSDNELPDASCEYTDASCEYSSDVFFRNCIETNLCDKSSEASEAIIRDSDGFAADAFYVILDKPYQYFASDNIEEFVDSETVRIFSGLKEECRVHGKLNLYNFIIDESRNCQKLRFLQWYDSDIPKFKLCVSVGSNLGVSISVHNKLLPWDHPIWNDVPRVCLSLCDVQKVLNSVSKLHVCRGNFDPELQNLIPSGAYLDFKDSSYRGYHDNYMEDTIRSTACKLVTNGGRCGNCSQYRKTLRTLLVRREKGPTKVPTPEKNWVTFRKPNNRLSETEKFHKLKQVRAYARDLEVENRHLKSEINKIICNQGVDLESEDSSDIFNVMNQSEGEINKTYAENSYQRLFWNEQLKYNRLKNKKSMRWHPMMIRWCIFLKSKSSGSYDALRNSGFVKLPSERTLYDYTNFIKKGVGFQADIVSMLDDEINKKGNISRHQKLVGLLHDEIRIKSDLVYDKHSGELIGFVDLGKVNNELQHIDECVNNSEKQLAKYVWVLMVRGISTNLKFPLAHFATTGITSDQLFPIIWKGIEILEVDLGLSVLFITSDGASPNRRFTRLHRGNQQDLVIYRAENIFAPDERFIYFISDAPHLIKTARNCLSNSYAHKKSRRMWKNGKDLSWLHIIDLYNEHCTGVYRRCYKLTKSHMDVSSFGAMKVSYAAQVLSGTVADALEMLYGDHVSETVIFIRHMNKFFDCLNVRNLKESTHTRNENIKPFTSADDPRLDYLIDDFLKYFDDWRVEVENRPGQFTRGQLSKMQVSYQTLEGLEMTVRSVVECVKVCLSQGMDFVMTNRFNQDPIEQHFGIHRTSGGCNNNPTVYQLSNNMVRIRTVGSQVIAPIKANTKRKLQLAPIDATPIQKRRRHSK